MLHNGMKWYEPNCLQILITDGNLDHRAVIGDHRTVIKDHPDDWVVDDEVDIDDPPENI
jgi:hypothetical protein